MIRRYLDSVQIWQGAATVDGYGGQTLQDSLLGTSWCQVLTTPVDNLSQLGLDVVKTTATFRFRHRNDIDYTATGIFLKYKSKTWTIVRVSNVNLEDKYVEIIATTS